LLRPLSSLENMYRILHEMGANIVVAVAQVEGDLSIPVLEKALHLIVQRHPMLRASLVQTDGKYGFHFREQAVPNVHSLRRQDHHQWVKIAEEEIHQRFDVGHSLWRLTVLTDPELCQHEIIFTYHHSIADGISHLIFLHELLSCYQQLTAGITPALLSLVPPVPIEHLIYARLGLSYVLKKLGQKLRPHQPILEGSASLEQRRTHIVPRSLGAALTQRLQARCRQEQTTIHGALCAAMLLSAQSVVWERRSARLLCDSSINLRPLINSSDTYDGIGSRSSIIELTHHLHPKTQFWDLARECKAGINQAIRRKEPQRWLALVHWLGTKDTVLQQQAQENMGRSSTVAVSNLGQFPFSSVYGEVELKSIHFAGGIHGIGSCLWLGAATCQGRMALSFAYVVPLMSETTALSLIKAVCQMLEQVCERESPPSLT
jgi:NRPS condensation-like uncharacterized protein